VATIGARGIVWPPPGAEDSISWRLMSALADEARFERGGNGPAIHLTKRFPRSTDVVDGDSGPSS